MPSIDKLRHNIRHAVSLSAFSPNLIHRIRYFFLCTVTFRDHSHYSSIYHSTHVSEKKSGEDKKTCVYFALFGRKVKKWAKSRMILAQNRIGKQVWIL